MRNKRGQEVFGMSFGVIFSIFLIIFFIVIAFIAIKAFLSTQQCAKIEIFKKDLQYDIDKAWNSQDYSSEFKRNLPSSLQYVCFANVSGSITATGVEKGIGEEIQIYGEENNMFYYPLEKSCDTPDNKIKHLNTGEITKIKNPYCIRINKGIISFRIEKGFNDVLVKIR